MGKAKEIVGQKFGKLMVLERAGTDKQGQALWRCRCECGNEIIVRGTALRAGHTISCGCLRRIEDLVGKKYGRLTIIRQAPDYIAPNGSHRDRWVCLCECGKETIALGVNLRDGHTQSCGCLRKTNHVTHGGTGTRLFVIWRSMHQRCYNPKSISYEYYGARGIIICPEWKDDFSNFRKWALSNGYADNLSIDRIDVNGNYEPSNCRWATATEQRINQRPRQKDS